MANELSRAERINTAAEWIADQAEKAGRIKGSRKSYLLGVRKRLRTEDGALEEAEAEMRGEDRPQRPALEQLIPTPLSAVDGPQAEFRLEPDDQVLADQQGYLGRLGPEREAVLASREFLDLPAWIKSRGGRAARVVDAFADRFGGYALDDLEREIREHLQARMPIFKRLGELAWKNSIVVDLGRQRFLEAVERRLATAPAEREGVAA